MSEQAVIPSESDVVLLDLSVNDDELLRRFRVRVRQEIATHLSSGQPIYYCGLGDDTGKLFMRLPDGRRFEYRLANDGTRVIIRDVMQ